MVVIFFYSWYNQTTQIIGCDTMKTLYLTDLDGTLLHSDGSLSVFAKETVNFLSANHVLFTVSTARTYATVIPMFRSVNLRCPLVLMNGVCIYDPLKKQTVLHHPLDRSLGQKAEELFAKYGKNPMLYFEKDSTMRVEYKALVNEPQRNYVAQRDHFYNKGFQRVNAYNFDNGDFLYIVTLDKKEEIEPLYHEMNALPGVRFQFYADNYTDCYFLEGMCDTVSKATGAKEVKALLGADKIVAFGDNINDLPLFQAADECYAVQNAHPLLKEQATSVIGSNDDDAVMHFLLDRFHAGTV